MSHFRALGNKKEAKRESLLMILSVSFLAFGVDGYCHKSERTNSCTSDLRNVFCGYVHELDVFTSCCDS